MPLAVAMLVILLISALFLLFVMWARAIRRDFSERFDRITARLEDDANAAVERFLRSRAE